KSPNRPPQQQGSKGSPSLLNADSPRVVFHAPCDQCFGSTNPKASTAPVVRGQNPLPETAKRSNSVKTGPKRSQKKTPPGLRPLHGGRNTRSPSWSKKPNTGWANPGG